MLPPLDLAKLEAVLKLMEQYKIDEIACEELTVKKSRFSQQDPTPEQLLQQHTKPTLADAKAVAANRVAEVESWLENKE